MIEIVIFIIILTSILIMMVTLFLFSSLLLLNRYQRSPDSAKSVFDALKKRSTRYPELFPGKVRGSIPVMCTNIFRFIQSPLRFYLNSVGVRSYFRLLNGPETMLLFVLPSLALPCHALPYLALPWLTLPYIPYCFFSCSHIISYPVPSGF